MPLNEVKHIHVPLYDELTVVKIWPQMQDDEEFMQYFPSKFPKGRLPDREYFYNIMNTVQGEYLQALTKHAHDERVSPAAAAKANATIEITDEWYEKLNSVNYISSK